VGFNSGGIEIALRVLDDRLRLKDAPQTGLVVCGGSAMIALDLLSRATEDIDVLALVDSDLSLSSAARFPEYLEMAVREVSAVLDLSLRWLNNGPDFADGGSLMESLPDGIMGRLHRRRYGSHLTVFYIDRFDQIHFKVLAASGGQSLHLSDLMALEPEEEEMESAARWCISQDPSDGFRLAILSMYRQLGFGNVAERL
jgi:hypothetical protein